VKDAKDISRFPIEAIKAKPMEKIITEYEALRDKIDIEWEDHSAFRGFGTMYVPLETFCGDWKSFVDAKKAEADDRDQKALDAGIAREKEQLAALKKKYPD
jgi:hypothetical protein